MSESPHRGHERPLDLGAGRVAARVHDPSQRVAALAGEEQLDAGVGTLGVEARAERGELAHAVGPLVDEHADRVDVAQARARVQRVGEVQLGRVGLGERGRDAALGVARRRVRQLALRQHEHRQAPTRRMERGRQPCDAAPQHEDVEHDDQPRWLSPCARIQTRLEPRRCTASSSEIGRFASSTWTIVGAYAASSASCTPRTRSR